MLTVDSIDLHYGAAQALRRVSMTASLGEVTCVLGRNGVGKTSLMRAIVGQQPISAGSITLDGAPLAGMKPEDRARRGIAFVPQAARSSAADGEGEPRDRFRSAEARGPLHSGRDLRAVPGAQGHAGPSRRRPVGRQQQQLAIARALVTRPKLLVLDEPTEGIQPSIIKDIGRTISYLRNKGDMAIVLVEQYLDFAKELADRWLVMDRGEVTLAGDKASLDEGEIRRRMSV